jgi:hypothetical protein
MPHTDDREFEGWPVAGFHSRSWAPEREVVKDGPQRPKLRRTSTLGILNCVRVLMENKVMVFSRREGDEPPSPTKRAR